MTYDEFKTYMTTHLWKSGDSVVIASLDTIIATAETELNRKLKVEDRETVAIITATADTVDLPDDCRIVRAVVSPLVGGLSYVTPNKYAELRTNSGLGEGQYTSVNNTLYLGRGGNAQASLPLQVWYYRDVPSFRLLAAADPEATSWVCEDYFDIYLYTCLKHTAPFLLQDERLQTWNNLLGDALLSILEENDFDRKYTGSPLKISFGKGIR